MFFIWVNCSFKTKLKYGPDSVPFTSDSTESVLMMNIYKYLPETFKIIEKLIY